MEWTIAALLTWATNYFSEKGIASPRLDAELLLAKTLQISRVQLYTHFDQPLIEPELAAFKALMKRRSAREPLAYILGEREFYSLNFKVSPAVLIPRPETEEWVESALQQLQARRASPLRLLDLATGSGCVLLALLKHLPESQGLGVDISETALQLAASNAERLGLADRCRWLMQDLRETWQDAIGGPFDLITANLPYVSQLEWETLEPELKEFEPKQALVPGPSGLEAFDWLLPQLESQLAPEGLAFLEIGMTQGKAILEKAKEQCPGLRASLHSDLSGRDRWVELKRS